MRTTTTVTRHAALVNLIGDYLKDSGRSARWLGIREAADARLVPNLIRGQAYPATILHSVTRRIHAFYEREAFVEALGAEAVRPARAEAALLEAA